MSLHRLEIYLDNYKTVEDLIRLEERVQNLSPRDKFVGGARTLFAVIQEKRHELENQKPNELKLEVGKFYTNRDKTIIGKVIHDFGGLELDDMRVVVVILGNNLIKHYAINGRYLCQPHKDDLVEEVEEPEAEV